MAKPRLVATAPLHLTWDASGLAAFGWERDRPAGLGQVRLAVSRILGAWWEHSMTSRTIALRLPDGGLVSVPAVVVSPEAAFEILTERYAGAGWTPSLRWFQTAAELAREAAASGRVLPGVEVAGLRWRAEWTLLADVALDAAIDRLDAIAPPVIWATRPPLRPGDPSPARQVVAAFADTACRWSLRNQGWRPPLGTSRMATVVALRRLCIGLSGHPMVVGTTATHEAALAAWSAGLAEVRATAEGGIPLSHRARILPPEEADDPWVVSFEAASADDPSSFATWFEVWAGAPEAEALTEGGPLGPVRRSIASHAARFAALVPGMEALGTQPEPAVLLLDTTAVAQLLIDGVDAATRAGVALLVPSGIVKGRVRLTARATAQETGGVTSSLGASLVEVDWGLALGDDALDPAALATLAASKAGLVKIRGEWVQVDAGQVRAALDSLVHRRERQALLSPAELLRLAAEATATEGDDPLSLAETASNGWLAELLAGLPDDRLAEVGEPVGFVGVLRPYQRRAVGWLQFLARLGLGGCLADDMGLGKTPTTLAHLQARVTATAPRDRRPSLVLCPLSVVHNWEAEAARFTPGLSTLVVHGSERHRGVELVAATAGVDLVITTYGTATRDVEGLAAVAWDVIVCDEAQTIKNHHTRAAKAVRKLPAAQKLALTGTPVENRLAELWAILDAVNPGMLGGITWFKQRFASPIEQSGDEQALAGLRRLTQPFVLRRTKADRSLLPDLPDKVEQIAWASLTREQAGLYQAVLDQFLAAAAEEEGMSRRGLVLATLTRLKQICNHPAHYLGDGGRLSGRSGKLSRFDELVDELLDAGDRALVFTQYREMGELLVRHLHARLSLDVPFLHGGVPKVRRDRMVARFQSGEGPPLQLVSLKAGGTGLNLTAASRVIHYDRWWNPAVENQATDRAWRIGQQSTVFVHKLVCQGTLEERIDALLEDKARLAGLAVGAGEAWLTELSTDDLRLLLQLDPLTAEGVA